MDGKGLANLSTARSAPMPLPSWLIVALAVFFLANVAPAPAQDSTPATMQPWSATPAAGQTTETPGESAKTAELQQRVQQLEAIVQRMQAQTGTVEQTQAQQGAIQPGQGMQAPFDVPPSPDGQTILNANPQSAASPIPPSSAFNPIASEGLTNPSANIGGQPFGGWKNGFFLESADKSFVLRLTGQVQADYREFLDSRDRTDMDTFLLRRARFGLEATIFKFYEFRFLPDFGNGTTIIQDAYMNIHYWQAFQFETGQFKQPFSYEQLIQDRYVPTLERSIIDQLVPERDLGAMIHGEEILDNRLDYGVALSNGEINGNTVDPNNHKDFNGRFAVRPFNYEDASDWFRGVQVGLSGGFGIEQEAINPATLRMPDTVPFLNFNSTVRADGLRWRICPEFVYFNGPFGSMAEYYHEEQEMRPSATPPGYKFLTNVPFNGYVLLSTLLLTGETRTTYSQPIDPLKPFDARCPIEKPGAWELVGRVSRLTVDDVFGKGAAQLVNPAKNSNEAMEFTLGFNWYLNKWVRVQFNYEHDMFGQPVLLGSTPANLLSSQDSLFTRFQVIF